VIEAASDDPEGHGPCRHIQRLPGLAAPVHEPPLRDPDHYKYELDIAAISEVWRRGSVIASWLLDLTAEALHETPELDEYAGRVSDSGEGRWTVEAAIDNAVPLPVITAALFARFSSRQDDSPAMKMVAALRNQFGGHAVEAVGAVDASDTISPS